MNIFKINPSKDMWTPETTRRALRTFWQAFFGTIAGGIAALVPEFGTPIFRFAVFVLVSSAFATGLAAAMNIEQVPDGNPGTDELPEVIEYTLEEVIEPTVENPEEGATDG